MAAEYFLYCTLYNNTLVCRSNNSFAPLPPNTGEILIDYFIPETQSLYLYRESSGSITINNSTIINEYLEATNPPSADEYITYKIYSGYTGTTKLQLDNIENDIDFLSGKTDNNYVIFTGYTANTNQRLNGVDDDIMYLSGATTDLTSDFNQYVNITAPNQFVNVTGDSMTGTLRITGALSATERISGLTAYGSSCVYSPIICGTSCAISPITIGSTCVCSPVVFGSVSVCSPTVCSSTCLCSTGTARFTGAVTDASTLNVSGATILGSTLRTIGATTLANTLSVSGVTRLGTTTCLVSTPTIGSISTDRTLFWNPTDKSIKAIQLTGGSDNYFYSERTTQLSTTQTTCQLYIGYCPTTFIGGKYQVDFDAAVKNSATNRCSLVAFKIDGVTQGINFIKYGVSISSPYISKDITLTAGTHCFNVYYWSQAGTTTIYYANVRVKRIS